jgi:hypothetical protein
MSDTDGWKEHRPTALGVEVQLEQHAGPVHTPRVHKFLADYSVLLYRKPGFTSAYPVPGAGPPA